MPYILNSRSATPYINGSKATVRLNGNIVYRPASTNQQVYIGTSSSSDNSTYDTEYVSDSSSATQSDLE